ncbi:9662_t:CDS:10 [Diversispora eburnea]|uniref:Ubiquitin carboxyl-terminal hydrolase n=1 Tax=Diversispora eburnea TaxID=1213867 RepID=A0A9N9BZV4_9GLOM|nr:9662_t:CDS:10 [Diversispora eburnea]
MDNILRSLLAANNLDDAVKIKFVEKLFTTVYKMAESEWKLLCEFSYELLKESSTRLHAEIGEMILRWIAHTQQKIYLDHFNSRALECCFIHAISSTFQHLRATSKVIKYKYEIAENTVSVEKDLRMLRSQIEKYYDVIKGRRDWQMLLVTMFYDLPKSIPSDRNIVLNILINSLANLTDEPTDDFVKKSVDLIEYLWGESSDTIPLSINEIFTKLTSSQQCSTPLIILISKIPIEKTSVILPYLQKTSREGISRLETGIQQMIRIIPHPLSKNIGVWIVKLMEALVFTRNIDLLLRITRTNVLTLFKYLLTRKSRQDALLVIRYTLLGYQAANDVFHTIVPLFPDVLDVLFQDGETDILLKLSGLAQCLMHRFPSHNGIYIPLTNKLDSLSMEIMRTLQENTWNKRIYSSGSITESVYRTASRPLKPKKKIGLNNLGNTCFMNSVIQALFNTTEFQHRILQTSCPRIRTSTLNQLQQCFNSLMEDKAYISPSALLETLPKWLNNGRQQDCHEFLKILFSQIEEESKQYMSNNIKRTKFNHPQRINTNQPNQSDIPISPFGGILVNTIKCLSCGNRSRTKEEFHDLTLSLQIESERENLSFTDLLSEFFSAEELKGDNQYHCDKCSGLQDALKTTRILVPPRYLILSLNRFEYDKKYARRIKIMTHVSIQDTLSLSYILKKDKNVSKVTRKSAKHKINHYVNGSGTNGIINGVNGNHFNGYTNGITNGVETNSTNSTNLMNTTNATNSANSMNSINTANLTNTTNSTNTMNSLGGEINRKAEYDLSAIVIHSGSSAEYGHYYTYAKDEGR